MPNRLVTWGCPAILAVALAVLVGLGITGSSTGFLQQFFSSQSDPALISGTPQSIRSDEWAVQTAWTISQVEQGLPVENRTFPGGSDTTVQSDLPSTDWSVAFRPHLAGFFFFPLDNAMSLKWWLPAFAMIAACYLFLVSLLPRRPVTAAVLSTAFFFAPFFQWWFLPITFWPVTWCFLVMTATIWLVREKRLLPRIGISAAVGYTTVTMGMGVYVPFIVPVVFVAAAFSIGFTLSRSSTWAAEPLRRRLYRLLPLLVAGATAVGVLVVWLLTRMETIDRFLSTIYPGQRLGKTGDLSKDGLVSLFGAPVTESLGLANGQPLGGNASEASTFFLFAMFLLIPLAWFAWKDRRSAKLTDWVVVALAAVTAVILAYLLVPGWDRVAHILLLDRTTTGRIRIALGVLSIIVVAVTISRTDTLRSESGTRPPRLIALVAVCVGAVPVFFVLRYLLLRDAGIIENSTAWIFISVISVVAIYFFARGWALAGASCFLAASLLGSAGVNPIYVGVYDLNETRVVSEMKSLAGDAAGAWVGVGDSFLPTAILVQSGLPSYNGFQGAPSPEMWDQIDPAEEYEVAWNRLANISWVAGEGEPDPTNPGPDQILMTFDSCAAFAQDHVKYILAVAETDQACMQQIEVVEEGPSTFFLYEVLPLEEAASVGPTVP
ncbi:hypothetical protein [Cryobacterium sp. Y29]|uniref:DUF7657 domain-containing protein n=1 Tax=Cryobacterium sp. Y29 TaxID=2048285 RepID=UPI000CE387BE|nr:hypothetical protein [Cryobacterium sp. Y29]